VRAVLVKVDLERSRHLVPGKNYVMDLGLGAQRVYLFDWWPTEERSAILQLVALEEWEDYRPDPKKFVITDDDRQLMSAMGIKL
jgi:hypothetical protein